jgi:hypothetical protein
MNRWLSLFFIFGFSLLFSSAVLEEFSTEAGEETASEQQESDNCVTYVTRSDGIPEESIIGASDPYFEGYIQALVDMHFFEYRVIVLVKDHTVWLANMPKNAMLSKSIVSFIKDIPGVEDVKIVNGMPPKQIAEREKYVNRPQVGGIWFPQVTELYLPMIADPRCVTYSICYRGGDKVIGKEVIAVSLGDDFPIFRWLDVGRFHGDLQIGIEACVWSVFNMCPHHRRDKGTALANSDYYVGIPLSYAANKWSYRFRAYHISSHLGDEFLVNHPVYVMRTHPKKIRKNPSYEAVDLFVSFQASQAFRLYVGAGAILHSDDSFPMDHCYIEYGGEARFFGTRMYYHRLYGTFFAAVFFSNWQYRNWDIDATYMAGYEWSKLQGIGRKIRLLTSYHHGFSEEGQFSKKRTKYGTVGFAYGF